MSNETEKEIYKEYCDVIINALDSNIEKERENIKNINKQYLYGTRSIYDHLNLSESDPCGFFEIMDLTEIELFARAPKTQMINGHKVVAPRYDIPTFGDMCFWLRCANKEGFAQHNAESLMLVEREALAINGWFDNKSDIIEYAKAHRESK